MHPMSFTRRGFTLIELLLVIGIIAILASIVIVAINPTRQLGQSRDAQRRADVNTIVNAIYQYSIDNDGQLPGNLRLSSNVGDWMNICKTTYGQEDVGCMYTAGSGVSLRMLSGAYVVSIPADPQAATSSGWTKYRVMRGADGRITIAATAETQGAPAISVTK